jgi:hypothetical protein
MNGSRLQGRPLLRHLRLAGSRNTGALQLTGTCRNSFLCHTYGVLRGTLFTRLFMYFILIVYLFNIVLLSFFFLACLIHLVRYLSLSYFPFFPALSSFLSSFCLSLFLSSISVSLIVSYFFRFLLFFLLFFFISFCLASSFLSFPRLFLFCFPFTSMSLFCLHQFLSLFVISISLLFLFSLIYLFPAFFLPVRRDCVCISCQFYKTKLK